MTWNNISAIDDIATIKARSVKRPCLIFKHSTSCEISSIAKYRLESDWNFEADQLEPYYLDLIANRPISNYIAEAFEVYHESPQILLIVNGECIHDASHLDITVQELHDVLPSVANVKK
jgi:bacillithiol system protein YtxJ